jgi:pimeloyl-ACP methyl ester carboxylesterase
MSWQVGDLRLAGARYVESLGQDVRWDVQGPEDGIPLVLVHGFGSSMEAWEPILPQLTDRYRVVRIDLPGFGHSSKREGSYRPEDLAHAVLRVADEAGFQRFHLVGHSMGGLVSLVLTDMAPDRVDRVVLMAPFVYDGQLPWGLRASQPEGGGELIFGLWYGDFLDYRFGMSFWDKELLVTESLLEAARRAMRKPGTRSAALRALRQMDLSGHEAGYARVEQRVLVIAGREDRVARLAWVEHLAATLPRGELDVVPWCGHFPMIEAPDHTASQLRRFLGRGPG